MPAEITPLNNTVEFECNCNCMNGGVLPKPGSVACGETGVEFTPNEKGRHVRIAWETILLVKVDIFRGEVRTLDLHLDDSQVVTLVPDDGEGLVRHMGAHLNRDVFESANEGAQKSGPNEGSLLEKIRRFFR